MRSILKALGLSIWGAIAILLSVVFIVAAFQVAKKFRASTAFDFDNELNNPTIQSAGGSAASVALPARAPDASPVPLIVRSAAETRKLFMAAFIGKQYPSAIDYGKELVERHSAGPPDLSILAQAYFGINDCANAVLWKGKAREAFQAAGMDVDASLQALVGCCDTTPRKPLIALDSPQRARLAGALERSPAASMDTGNAFVRMGQLYYGFGEYELAVAAIERGLDKGNIAHLEDAYVYLGRSEVALGEMEAARDAFAKLKEVPGISPRILRLWTLYAETRLQGASSKTNHDAAVINDAECRKTAW